MSVIGIFTGFYGYIFPGNINLMMLQLYKTKQNVLLFFMLLLILIFESFYLWLSIFLITKIEHQDMLLVNINLVSNALLLIMGLWMIFEKKNEMTVKNNTIKRGIFCIIFHPQQIPFWFIITTIIFKLTQYKIELNKLTSFILNNALGTLLIMIFYMVIGNKIINYFKLNIAKINRFIGVIYIAMFVYNITF